MNFATAALAAPAALTMVFLRLFLLHIFLLSSFLSPSGRSVSALVAISDEKQVARGAKPKYSGMVDCAKQLHATGGLRSVFKGWEVTLVRDVPG